MKILSGYFLTFGWVFLILGLTMVLKKAARAGEELTRKIVHISVAFAWIPMYFCFGACWHLVVPPAVFILLNYISYRSNLFSGMERSDESKKSPGTVYYAVSMTFMAGVSVFAPQCLVRYGTALFCMALGDGLAPLFGGIRRGNRQLVGSRTLYGSISVFAVCFLVVLFMARLFALPLALWQILLVAAEAVIMELAGVRGLDNLTLPIGVFALLNLFLG